MKMKKSAAILLAAMIAAASLTGCGEQAGSADAGTTTQTQANTVATKLFQEFQGKIASGDIETVAGELSESALFSEMSMATMVVEEGYLNGFDDQITGFQKGVMVAPMIGSIPFITYLFETSDADALMTTLRDHAQLNWNICTTADEMVIEKSGNYVFFAMAPFRFE